MNKNKSWYLGMDQNIDCFLCDVITHPFPNYNLFSVVVGHVW